MGTPSASSTGVYGRPTPSATAGWVTWPAATFTPDRSPGSFAIAPSTPWSASASTYGRVAFVSANVEVAGTAPGMLVTQ